LMFRRWLLFSRSGLPSGFTRPLWLRGFEFWAAFVVTLLAFAKGHSAVALLSLFAIVTLGWSVARLQERFGGAPIRLRHLWFVLGVYLLAPIIFALARARRAVLWRGRAYHLNAEARLA